MIEHGRDCSNHKSYHLARLTTPKCKVRYLAHLNHFRKHVWPDAWLQFLPWLLLLYFHDTEVNSLFDRQQMCARLFKFYWSKLPFRSATGVTPNYLNSLNETVFFSACCGLTHSVVCTSCIVVGNTRQCLLYVLFYVLVVVCYKNKFLSL